MPSWHNWPCTLSGSVSVLTGFVFSASHQPVGHVCTGISQSSTLTCRVTAILSKFS